MTNIFFIRHGQLIPPFDDYSELPYEKLVGLATGKLEPDLHANSIALFKAQTMGLDFSQVGKVYFNNSGFHSRRSKESAELIVNILGHHPILEGFAAIREVHFDVSKLITKEEFQKSRVQGLRKKIFEAQINDLDGVEPIEEIKRLLDDILEKVEQVKNDTIFVTHDFLMRYIQLFIERGPIEDITVEDLLGTRKNDFFSGFYTTKDLRGVHFFGNN